MVILHLTLDLISSGILGLHRHSQWVHWVHVHPRARSENFGGLIKRVKFKCTPLGEGVVKLLSNYYWVGESASGSLRNIEDNYKNF